MASPIDLGFDLIPADPGLLSPDLALDAALAPVVDLGEPDLEPLGRGWDFDFVNEKFVRRGTSPARIYDLDNIRMWIEKALRTARNAHPIYTDSYGMVDPFLLIGEPPEGDLLAQYQQQVVDALTVHDRIAAVDGFYFEHDPMDDAIYVSFVVTLDAEAEQTIQVDSLRVS